MRPPCLNALQRQTCVSSHRLTCPCCLPLAALQWQTSPQNKHRRVMAGAEPPADAVQVSAACSDAFHCVTLHAWLDGPSNLFSRSPPPLLVPAAPEFSRPSSIHGRSGAWSCLGAAAAAAAINTGQHGRGTWRPHSCHPGHPIHWPTTPPADASSRGAAAAPHTAAASRDSSNGSRRGPGWPGGSYGCL